MYYSRRERPDGPGDTGKGHAPAVFVRLSCGHRQDCVGDRQCETVEAGDNWHCRRCDGERAVIAWSAVVESNPFQGRGWDLSDLQAEAPASNISEHRKDPLAGLTPDEMILRCVREMNDDEREVWAEQGAGLLRGRVLYGPLDLLRNDKCWPDEASEEQRDLATYQAMEVCKRRRAK